MKDSMVSSLVLRPHACYNGRSVPYTFFFGLFSTVAKEILIALIMVCVKIG